MGDKYQTLAGRLIPLRDPTSPVPGNPMADNRSKGGGALQSLPIRAHLTKSGRTLTMTIEVV